MLNVEHKEVGRPIKNFEKQYEVSSYGRISNYRKIMQTYEINSGYLAIKFTLNGVRTSHLVHRLVAKAFLDNPENKTEVNHIDGNKHNNHVSNLEWVSSSENKKHALATGLKIYNNPTVGKKLGTGSKYYNVTYDKARDKYMASIAHVGVRYYQKRFDNEIDAAKHVNWIIDTLGLTNRPKNVFN